VGAGVKLAWNLLVQASHRVRQALHTWDAVGRSRPRRCATPTGTGDRSHWFGSQSCGESGSRLTVATRAKWWGSMWPLRYVLFPRATEYLTGEPIQSKVRWGWCAQDRKWSCDGIQLPSLGIQLYKRNICVCVKARHSKDWQIESSFLILWVVVHGRS